MYIKLVDLSSNLRLIVYALVLIHGQPFPSPYLTFKKPTRIQVYIFSLYCRKISNPQEVPSGPGESPQIRQKEEMKENLGLPYLNYDYFNRMLV